MPPAVNTTAGGVRTTMKQNVFTKSADSAEQLAKWLESRMRVEQQMIDDLNKMHVYLLGIGRLGLSSNDNQRHDQMRALEYANTQVMAHMMRMIELMATESHISTGFSKAIYDVYEHVDKNGWPIGRDQAQGL
jgi:hypothetical protein